jgi:hypothetical protein
MRNLAPNPAPQACSVLVLTDPGHDLEDLAAELRGLGHEVATMDRVTCAPFIRQVVCDAIIVPIERERDARVLAALALAHPEPRYLALVGSVGAALAALRTSTAYLPLGARPAEISRALALVAKAAAPASRRALPLH